MARLTYVHEGAVTGEWDTEVRGQTLRCEGLPDSMFYSGDRHAMRAGARCRLYRSPASHSPQHPCCCNPSPAMWPSCAPQRSGELTWVHA
eukprot:7348244-Prymnesium_polylepis.1